MFDEVCWKCQKCNNTNIEQTKYGPCELRTYSLHSASAIPLSILEEFKDKDLWCEECGGLHSFKLQCIIQGTLILDSEDY